MQWIHQNCRARNQEVRYQTPFESSQVQIGQQEIQQIKNQIYYA